MKNKKLISVLLLLLCSFRLDTRVLSYSVRNNPVLDPSLFHTLGKLGDKSLNSLSYNINYRHPIVQRSLMGRIGSGLMSTAVAPARGIAHIGDAVLGVASAAKDAASSRFCSIGNAMGEGIQFMIPRIVQSAALAALHKTRNSISSIVSSSPVRLAANIGNTILGTTSIIRDAATSKFCRVGNAIGRAAKLTASTPARMVLGDLSPARNALGVFTYPKEVAKLSLVRPPSVINFMKKNVLSVVSNAAKLVKKFGVAVASDAVGTVAGDAVMDGIGRVVTTGVATVAAVGNGLTGNEVTNPFKGLIARPDSLKSFANLRGTLGSALSLALINKAAQKIVPKKVGTMYERMQEKLSGYGLIGRTANTALSLAPSIIAKYAACKGVAWLAQSAGYKGAARVANNFAKPPTWKEFGGNVVLMTALTELVRNMSQGDLQSQQQLDLRNA